MTDAEQAIADVVQACKHRRSFTFYTLNLDHCVKLRHSETFRRAYERATFVSADGAPLVWLAKAQGYEIGRFTGADAVVPMCRSFAREHIRVGLVGSTEEVLRLASDELRRLHPGLVIAGRSAPRLDPIPTEAQVEGVVRDIRDMECHVVFLAFGAPKQELLADAAAQRIEGCGFVCVGAALDFIAGRQRRAPTVMRRLGVEWIWRLALQPRRLAARYARCGHLMAIYVGGAMISAARHRYVRPALPDER